MIKKKFVWGFIIAVAIIVILFFVFNKPTTQIELSIGNSPVLGDANASVIIYEFTDFSCPYCKASEGANGEVENALKSKYPGWEAPMPLVKENYVKTGKVKIVFKYFPGHGSAEAAHAVAWALNNQSSDLFWKFEEEAFKETENLNNINKMIELAVSLGGDKTKIESYIASKKYETQMDNDIAMGESNEVGGTPSFFINGEVVAGAQSYSTIRDVIESKLN